MATLGETLSTVEYVGAVTREGGNTTEATTTSTTAVDLLSDTGMSISAPEPIFALASTRKTTGAADNINTGLVLNTTEVRLVSINSSFADAADEGHAVFIISARLTDYTGGGHGFFASDSRGAELFNINSNDMPTATITVGTIRGSVNNASITMGADEFHVYSLATS